MYDVSNKANTNQIPIHFSADFSLKTRPPKTINCVSIVDFWAQENVASKRERCMLNTFVGVG